mmetsp:Transcript_24275/g.23884  ORF Transcript_24275/g.23884 Transcript_24275/m.23884 type:complete len:102 (+) Transcript_24275:991-1296(+)
MNSLEKNDFFKENMQHVKKVIEIKKKDPHDLIYWVKQVLEVGTQHLVPKDTVKLNFLQLNDMDIHLALFCLILWILFILGWTIRGIYKYCCCPKKSKQKAE